MLKRAQWLLGAMLILVLLGTSLAGCGETKEPDKITVQLSWYHTVEFAGFYAAVQQGYYQAENISVTLRAGAFDILPWEEVVAGRADFGIAGGDSLAIARSEGKPLQAVAVIFRRNPVVFIALTESGIRTPKDMVGKRIGVISQNLDNTNDIQLMAMLQKMGVQREDVTLVPIEDYSLASLTSGQMDVYSGFSTNEAVDAQIRNLPVNLIFPEDYGVVIYGNVLFATERLLQENPDLAVRFLRATFKGYRYAIEHPDEVAALAVKYDPTLDLSFQQRSMRAEIPLIDTGDAPLGTMDPAVWQSTQEILLQQGFLSAPVDQAALFSNEFINKAGNK